MSGIRVDAKLFLDLARTYKRNTDVSTCSPDERKNWIEVDRLERVAQSKSRVKK